MRIPVQLSPKQQKFFNTTKITLETEPQENCFACKNKGYIYDDFWHEKFCLPCLIFMSKVQNTSISNAQDLFINIYKEIEKHQDLFRIVTLDLINAGIKTSGMHLILNDNNLKIKPEIINEINNRQRKRKKRE